MFKFSKEKGYYYLKYYEDCITDNSYNAGQIPYSSSASIKVMSAKCLQTFGMSSP